MNSACNLIKNPTVLSVVISVTLVYGLNVPANLVILMVILSSIFPVLGIGYYAYKNPIASMTAYGIFMSDVKDIFSQLSNRSFNEVIHSDVKIVTTPSGTHIIPLSAIDYVPHTLQFNNSDGSITIYNMAENCDYDISPDNVDCQSIVADANGIKIRVNGSRSINPGKIRTRALS